MLIVGVDLGTQSLKAVVCDEALTVRGSHHVAYATRYPAPGVAEQVQREGARLLRQPPEGFDFGNSPTQTNELDLTGKTIIQRTGAGTQGIVRCRNAETLLAASFVVAGPTARYIRSLETDRVTFVITGETFSGGEEDFACAEYLQALISGIKPDPLPFIQRVHNSRDAILHLDPNQTTFPRSDLDLCSHIDAFDFAMLVTRENGRHIMRTVNP